MAFITRYWQSKLKFGLVALLAFWSTLVAAGSIEPVRASLTPSDDGYTLSAEFAVDLGARLEEAVSRGVALTFNLEFTLSRKRWYWIDEHVAGHVLQYRLSYNALTRQYRLSVGSMHQSFASLDEALHVIGRLAALPVAAANLVHPGEIYTAALRLSLDKSQLPKPFQVDAIANPDWLVDAKVLRWQFNPPGDAK
jgi:hypothetical protein